MAQKTRPQAESLYGLPQPLQTGLFAPIIAKRDATSADTGYPLAQTWDNKVLNKYWVLLSVSGGSAVWGEVITNGGGSVLIVANGGTGRSTLTAHAVLLGEGTNPVGFVAAVAAGQALMSAGTTSDPAYSGSPSFSGSVTAATTITATAGNITATNGNLVSSTSGKGLTLTPVVNSGGPGAVTVNGRVFSATFTGVSIASGATQAFDIANTSITGSGTLAIVDWSGATAGSALSKVSQVSTAGNLTITMTNGTSATMVTDIADITFTGIVLN